MVKRSCILFLMSLLPFGCVEEFEPGDYGDSPACVVVDAVINDLQEEQLVKISLSSPVSDSGYVHLSGCRVKVSDKYDHEFAFTEGNSAYEGRIDRAYLHAGNAFKLSFTTPEGKEYESSWDEMAASASIDSVYWVLEDSRTELRFYVDFRSREGDGKYYKWDLEETYEHHATWPIGNYYDDNKFVYAPYTYDLFVCYSTMPVQKIYTLSALNLNENVNVRMPLHSVDNSTQRLFYRYSLLVSQASLSAEAYSFWEKLKQNNQEAGGIFDTQPVNTQGNMSCLSNPDEKVLGFFGASCIRTERIFVRDVPELEFPHYFMCDEVPIETIDILNSTETSWPIYFVQVPPGYPGYLTGDYDCFDCRQEGGDTIPPDYWRDDPLIEVP